MKLALHNQRMIDLMEQSDMLKKDFLVSIGFTPNNITQVYSGKQSFTLDHIAAAIKKYNLDANYFFRKDGPMMYDPESLGVADLLKMALNKL